MISLVSAIKELPSDTTLTAAAFENGPKISPLKIIQTYDSGEWEAFIDEWIHSLKDTYLSVMRATGAGDKGIDVAGLCDKDELKGVWDNYQCKSNSNAIGFSVIAGDIGKILWHSFQGEYVAPRKCFFIAPKGPSTPLSLLLANADNLKKRVIEDWNKSVAPEISVTPPALTGAFSDYVEVFDFRIFSAASPLSIIEAHSKTRFHIGRFGGGLPRIPNPPPVPTEIEVYEGTYTSKLLDAYAEHKGCAVSCAADIDKWPPLKSHFQRSREAFYGAESLRVFVREKVEPGTFEGFQEEILGGVLDIHDDEHPDGFARVKAVTEKAQSIVLDAHPLNTSALPHVRRGVCHQLANDGKLTWKR